MVEVEVNNRKVVVESGWPLIEVCRMAGVEIPRFCYHESLGIAGNCRMCLVEVQGAAKPVASCAMPVAAGMKIQTESLLVKKAREGIMEFLLANHPLDCPICDQGGECDLQDQAMVFGNDRGRFYEMKRAVEDKECGPLVKTVMTRCIHCTRCVRFMSEVAGTNELGTMGRGNSMEIGGYLPKKLRSEVSGNVIDLCPVGALTAKPHAFMVRPWELRSIESVDTLDSLGSNISVQIRGNEILRVLPVVNDEINQNWITDKTRFAVDGLRSQRLLNPMIRVNGVLVETSWEEAFRVLAYKIHSAGRSLDVVVGNLVELESIIVVKDLIASLGVGRITSQCNLDFVRGDMDLRKNYMFNTPLNRIEEADICLLVGTNIRVEMPLIAVRLRRAQKDKGLLIYTIGAAAEYFFEVWHLGSTGKVWLDFLEGRHLLCKKFQAALKPLVILGLEGMFSTGSSNINKIYNRLSVYKNLNKEGWDGRNVLQLGASNVGLLELGVGEYITRNEKGKILYLLGADEVELRGNSYDLIVYQGHHGDVMAEVADIVLPGSAPMEKEGVYVNLEGRWQQSHYVVTPYGEVRTDWSILRCLTEYLVEYKGRLHGDLRSVRNRLYEVVPYEFNSRGYVTLDLYVEESSKLNINLGSYNSLVDNFYMTDSISRASKVMSLCTKELL